MVRRRIAKSRDSTHSPHAREDGALLRVPGGLLGGVGGWDLLRGVNFRCEWGKLW